MWYVFQCDYNQPEPKWRDVNNTSKISLYLKKKMHGTLMSWPILEYKFSVPNFILLCYGFKLCRYDIISSIQKNVRKKTFTQIDCDQIL